jgi:UMF1 family MFS transporter
MMMVEVDRGRADGAALAKTLQELSRARDAVVEEEEEEEEGDEDNLSQEVRDGLEASFSYQRS